MDVSFSLSLPQHESATDLRLAESERIWFRRTMHVLLTDAVICFTCFDLWFGNLLNVWEKEERGEQRRGWREERTGKWLAGGALVISCRHITFFFCIFALLDWHSGVPYCISTKSLCSFFFFHFIFIDSDIDPFKCRREKGETQKKLGRKEVRRVLIG